MNGSPPYRQVHQPSVKVDLWNLQQIHCRRSPSRLKIDPEVRSNPFIQYIWTCLQRQHQSHGVFQFGGQVGRQRREFPRVDLGDKVWLTSSIRERGSVRHMLIEKGFSPVVHANKQLLLTLNSIIHESYSRDSIYRTLCRICFLAKSLVACRVVSIGKGSYISTLPHQYLEIA
jgi:hypothetical protein